MSELALTNQPELLELDCFRWMYEASDEWGHHCLRYLDLSGAPNLKRLDCRRNLLAELDLNCVTQLRELDCSSNALTDLDLSRVPMLEVLRCGNESYHSVWIERLDIRPLLGIKELHCDKCTLLIQRPDQHFHA